MTDTMDLKNDVLNHLAQFPYLYYSTKENGGKVIITFNKDVNKEYVEGLFSNFEFSIISENPVSVSISKIKDIISFDEFKGKIIIQNIEDIDLPDLGIEKLQVKIDSGATVSCLGVSKLKVDKSRGIVSFIPLDSDYSQYTGKMYSLPLKAEITVQSSNGEEEVRPMIITKMILKGKELETFFSLADRSDLEFPVLIGKDVLSRDFLIKPGK